MIELIKQIAEELEINPPPEILERIEKWYICRCEFSVYSKENARKVIRKRLELLKTFRSPAERDRHLIRLENWIQQIVPPALKSNAPDYLAMLQAETWGKFQQELDIVYCKNKWEEAEWWSFFYAYPKRRLSNTGKTILQTRVYDWVRRNREHPHDFTKYEIGYNPSLEYLEALDWIRIKDIFIDYLVRHHQQDCANYINAHLKSGGEVSYIHAVLNVSTKQRDYIQQRTKYWSGKFLTDAREVVKIREVLDLKVPPGFDELVALGKYREATKLMRQPVKDFRSSTTPRLSLSV